MLDVDGSTSLATDSRRDEDLDLVRWACHPIEMRKHESTLKRMMRDLKEGAADALVIVSLQAVYYSTTIKRKKK